MTVSNDDLRAMFANHLVLVGNKIENGASVSLFIHVAKEAGFKVTKTNVLDVARDLGFHVKRGKPFTWNSYGYHPSREGTVISCGVCFKTFPEVMASARFSKA